MPRNRLDGIKTKAGRVVYDRKKKEWKPADKARLLKALQGEAPLPDENKLVNAIDELVTTITEEMVATILVSLGLPPGLSDEVVAKLKYIVEKALKASNLFADYLREARGPIGIPFKGAL